MLINKAPLHCVIGRAKFIHLYMLPRVVTYANEINEEWIFGSLLWLFQCFFGGFKLNSPFLKYFIGQAMFKV